MNPYGAPPPGGARPPPGAPGYFSGPPPGGMPGPPGMPPSGGMPRPPSFAPSSFPQGAPPPRPAPSVLPPPRPTPRPAGPPPSLLPPGQVTPPKASAAPGPPSARPALKTPEPVKKLMASVTFIAPSVENDFLEKLFAVFGAVKSMKRPQDPSTNVRKTFCFVEFEASDSLKIALRVLPNQTIDGQDIQVKPTNPSKQYLDWWESHGRAAAGAAAAAAGEATEDGEAAADDDTAEMEATEAVMDLVARRMGTGGGPPQPPKRSGSSRGDDRGGKRGSDTDALIRGVAQEASRVDDRHVRLEREFEADRARKDRETEKDRRRDRKQAEDLMRTVRSAESDAARDRNRRAQRLSEMRDRRLHLQKQDNDASRRDEEEDGDKWRHTARQERQREAEADEADRMRELEEEASRRGAANAAAAASSADAPPSAWGVNSSGTVAGGAAPKGIVDMNDSIMKAMMQQVSSSAGNGVSTANGADNARASIEGDTPATNGGWSAVGGSAAGAMRLGGEPGADPGKAGAKSTKKAFFGNGSDESKPRPGAWLIEQRAKAAAEAVSQNGEVVPEQVVGGGGDELQERQAAFEADRTELMKRIPTSLESAGHWPLKLEALNLDSQSTYQHLLRRVAKYVTEVLPQDEDAIAHEVLTRVKAGDGARVVHDFCEFMGDDAAKFTLKVWRLLIAESELSNLRSRHGIMAA